MVDNKKIRNYVLGGIFIIAMALIFFATPLFKQSSLGGSDTVQIAVPHFASFKCDVVSDKPGLAYTIPTSGLYINQASVGFYTNSITNIKTSVDYGFWTSLIKDLRLRYQVCDVNGNNCGSEKIIKYVSPGTRQAVIDSVDLTKYSLKVYFEQLTLTNYIFGKWTPYEGAVISYDGKAFGLLLYSTTRDPAGSVVCSSSCDLSCPQQAVREKLVYTTKDTLDFYATAPYLEYWESLDYDLNAQGGATVYNADSKTFCLAGAVYTSKSLTLESGRTYIYPDTATRQQKQCCPGAVISTTYEDKVCQSDYTWKTISKDTKIRCNTDIMCPNAGQNTCQNKLLSAWSCDGSDSLGSYCVKSSGKTVTCCANSDCASDMVCQNNKCVGGNANTPIPPDNGGNNSDKTCTALAGGLIPANPGVQESCGLGCLALKGVTFGLVNTTSKTAVCVYDYTMLFILIGVLVAILATIILLKNSGVSGSRVKKEKASNTKKWTLIIVGVLMAIALFFIFMKTLLPIIIGIIVVALILYLLYIFLIKRFL